MPDESGAVGGLQLPIPGGTEKERLADPVVDALLDFAAFYIKDALDNKLQRLTGTSADAVPEANRFPFDPTQARGHAKKLPLPSLFVWWEGQSSSEEQTTRYKVRSRVIEFMYAFGELAHLEEMERRAGLLNAVDAAMHQMAAWQVRSDFGHGDVPNGSWITTTVADIQFFEWTWMGGQPGRFGIGEGPRAERRFAKKSGRDWPALKGSWLVEERVAHKTLQDPEDLMNDVPVSIYGSDGESTDVVHLMDRYLQSPDGKCDD